MTELLWALAAFIVNLVVGAAVWSGCDEDERFYRWYRRAPKRLAWLLQPLVLTCWPFAVYVRLRRL